MKNSTVTIPARCVLLQRDEIDRLPPSALRVYSAVLDHGPTTLPELQKRSGLPRRTVAFAIAKLKDATLISWHQRLDDYRVRYFFVHPRLVDAADEACRDAHRDGAVIRLTSVDGCPSKELVGPQE